MNNDKFITVRIWKETKEKLEEVRIKMMLKNKKVVSLAQTIEILIDEYNKNNK